MTDRRLVVLVCGGRDYRHLGIVGGYLDLTHRIFGIRKIIQGGSTGADRLALEWALGHRIEHETYKAEWDKWGKSAGPIRNQKMIDDGKPTLVIAFPGGSGTDDLVNRARRYKIPVMEIPHLISELEKQSS
jgi:SLOG family YspA-like protein